MLDVLKMKTYSRCWWSRSIIRYWSYNLELILADLESVEKRIGRVEKQAKQKDKDAVAEFAVLAKVRDILKERKTS